MLYYLFEYLKSAYDFPGAGLFQYISFRAGAALILSLLISIVIGKHIILWLRRMQIGETVRDLGLEGQTSKAGTPTMGGVIIIAATIIPCLMLARLDNVYILLMLFSTVWMFAIGFIDDYIKVFKKDKEGLKGIFKVMGQIGLGLIVGVTMLMSDEVVVRMEPALAEQYDYEVINTLFVKDNTAPNTYKEMVYVKAPITNVPFFKNNELDYSRLLWFLGDNARGLSSILFVIMTIFVITAVSNGANLTDGLDGQAAGVSAIVITALGILAYLSGNSVAADFLKILYIPYSGELVIYTACLIGGCIGFLWYNVYPARVFMGDTGSLTLGGIIAALAIIIRKELLIPVLCGVFLIENLSVIIQVWYFKRTKKKYGEGRRVFLMAPLHHHYQKQGYHEVTIAVRFWIIQILLAVLTVITLKIR
ncbi:MAG: phospho-N-acetylmuramoyl-pentapeptide-transferase [Lewinellaceae bacterium]|nr:phospho-N-acetylmuramoyl-pentapeptide-transferase [Saprospiraceae bacterium]MCB9308150.1 phospho-N-acetylmuramoyl-pentapeptide-transferase [Lewinellaceae bacterium]MCB9354777.1 phospho-N-acetylmuramoyl-pentapeptide-transferase [Lewinellaceae bacterium]